MKRMLILALIALFAIGQVNAQPQRDKKSNFPANLKEKAERPNLPIKPKG